MKIEYVVFDGVNIFDVDGLIDVCNVFVIVMEDGVVGNFIVVIVNFM